MKQKNALLLTSFLTLAALTPRPAEAHHGHGPHHGGVRLAADIVNLVGAATRLVTPAPVVVAPAPVVVPPPAPVVRRRHVRPMPPRCGRGGR